MWFITLIVLALAAFLIIKAVKAQTSRKTVAGSDSSQSSGLQGQLNRESASQDTIESKSAANDSGTVNTAAATSSTELNPSEDSEIATSKQSESDELREIREMIKVLNLAEGDSVRLEISAEQFNALRAEEQASVDTAAMPSRDTQAEIADRLRRMLA